MKMWCRLLLCLFAVIVVYGETDEEQWTKFKLDFGKSYSTPQEELHRFKIFKDNLRFIGGHNQNNGGNGAYTLKINGFADLSNDEFKDMFTG